MCGIVGIWSRTGDYDRQRLTHDLSAAVESLNHRGPDDSGIWTNDTGVGLGHTRLSILDLSTLGHQPMHSKDGRYVIVFNGEIYNFSEIKQFLISKGYAFAGNGDTEVILAAIREWGSSAVEQFIGMFAIAYWDEYEKKLVLIRDRIGVKPLYYGWDGRNLWFGSELKSLRPFSHWTSEIDKQSLGEYLQYGYIAAHRSIFKQIRKLEPGHRLTLKRTGEPVIERFWDVLDGIESPLQGTDAEIESELEALMDSAFRYRMVSDVPVGVYLSGGVDSSLVTAILAKNHDRPIRTFTIGFEETEHNEAKWAKKVAEHVGTIHTEYVLRENEALNMAREWGKLFDEPFGDSSGIPTLLVSRLASEEVKVVLSADGGDELFSGYRLYDFILRRCKSLERTPMWVKKVAAAGAAAIPVDELDWLLRRLPVSAARRGRLNLSSRRIRRLLSGSAPGDIFDLYLSYWLPDDLQKLLGNYSNPRCLADGYPGTIADKMSLWDFHHYLPEDILTKVDRTTMATSIEGREPLLDHRLVEFAFRLPLHLRRGEMGPKHILKSLLYKLVPRELVDRPKMGFSIPLEKWLRNDMKVLVQEFLDQDRIRNAGLFDPSSLQRTVDDFYAGNSRLTTQIWFALAFEMWREEWT